MILGLQMVSKVLTLFVLWNLVNPILAPYPKKEEEGRDPVKGINGIKGRGSRQNSEYHPMNVIPLIIG